MIAVEDNEPVDLRQRGERTLHRIARAARRILDHGDDVAGALKPAARDRRFRVRRRGRGHRAARLRRRAARAQPWECRPRYATVLAPVSACACPRPRQARRDQPVRLVAVRFPRRSYESLARLEGGEICAGDAAGGPGFEPGTKVPKTLVIPFHHPPTESTDPTGALTRGWCLPSPEGVYQRLLGVLAVACTTSAARRGPRACASGAGRWRYC